MQIMITCCYRKNKTNKKKQKKTTTNKQNKIHNGIPNRIITSIFLLLCKQITIIDSRAWAVDSNGELQYSMLTIL